jgi:hypothetical protein
MDKRNFTFSTKVGEQSHEIYTPWIELAPSFCLIKSVPYS